MTDFDQISAHSFRHLPSLGALGSWLLPLWCKNTPFGKSTALWRALLNYPKTFSLCTFITPREDKQGERVALKDRRSRSDVMDGWLRRGFKRTSTQSAFIVALIIQQNHLWHSNRLLSKHWLSTRSLRMTKAMEELKPTWSDYITPPPPTKHSSNHFILLLSQQKNKTNNSRLNILPPAQQKCPPEAAETRTFTVSPGSLASRTWRTWANEASRYANRVRLTFS